MRQIIEWRTEPGDLILDPFTGIGSVGVKALALGRQFVGIELKRSYFGQACKNLTNASHKSADDLFSVAVRA